MQARKQTPFQYGYLDFYEGHREFIALPKLEKYVWMIHRILLCWLLFGKCNIRLNETESYMILTNFFPIW